MQFTTLIENGPSSDFLYEHGLSFWIEFEGHTYLLDAGQSDAFMKNAHQLHLDISHPDACILSHGHNDHGGGFVNYIQDNPNHSIYMKEEALERHYSNSHDHFHEISIDPSLKKYAKYVHETTQIQEHVYLVPDDAIQPDPNSLLMSQKGNDIQPDVFDHELSLVFDTPQGLIIFNSCSHARFEGILPKIKATFQKPIYAYIGGLHLKDSHLTNQQYETLSSYIKENIPHLYTGHCTGQEACDRLPVQKLIIGKTIAL